LVIRGSIQLSGKQFSCNSHGSGIAWQIKLQRIIHSNQSTFWQWIRSLCQSKFWQWIRSLCQSNSGSGFVHFVDENSGSGFVYLAKSAAVVVANESARLHQTQRHQHLTWEGQSRLSKLPSVVQVDASQVFADHSWQQTMLYKTRLAAAVMVVKLPGGFRCSE